MYVQRVANDPAPYTDFIRKVEPKSMTLWIRAGTKAVCYTLSCALRATTGRSQSGPGALVQSGSRNRFVTLSGNNFLLRIVVVSSSYRRYYA
jgi:hypothetical protein